MKACPRCKGERQLRRIGIVGSRKRKDAESVRRVVDDLPLDCIVVSGHAEGPDLWAEEAAVARGLQVMIFPPDLSGAVTTGQRARRYHARNQQIVDAADEVIAFVSDERVGGTEDTIKRAGRKGIQVRIL